MRRTPQPVRIPPTNALSTAFDQLFAAKTVPLSAMVRGDKLAHGASSMRQVAHVYIHGEHTRCSQRRPC